MEHMNFSRTSPSRLTEVSGTCVMVPRKAKEKILTFSFTIFKPSVLIALKAHKNGDLCIPILGRVPVLQTPVQ